MGAGNGGQGIELSEAMERVLMESGLSISAFSRKVGYSRQYIYDLLKPQGAHGSREIQIDTLKQICDATGYGLDRLLSDMGYIPGAKADASPNTVIIVRTDGKRKEYHLEEKDIDIVRSLVKTLAKE